MPVKPEEPPDPPARDGQKRRDANSPAAASSQTVTPSQDEADWQIPPGGVDTYRTAAVHLRRPFTPEAVKFKVQAVFGKEEPNGALIVAYIDARLAIERLNLIVPHLWTASYTAVSDTKFLLCRLTVDGITREDVGESSKGFSKDLISDALKRAAVHFGVGVSLYAIPQMKLFKEHIANGNLKVTTSGGKKSLVITDKGDKKLRDGYAKWLEEHGARVFGPALDHGDREGAMDVPEAVADAPVSVQAAADAERASAAADETVAEYQRRVREGATA